MLQQYELVTVYVEWCKFVISILANFDVALGTYHNGQYHHKPANHTLERRSNSKMYGFYT